MTFETIERSRHLGEPITLYYFRWGQAPSAFSAYTDAEQIVPFDGVDYEPVTISRGKIVSSGNLDKSNLELVMPVTTTFANMFLVQPPSHVVTGIIRQGHLNDPDRNFPVIWAGRITSSGRKGNEATFGGEPVSTSMRRSGLRRHWQYSCPHALYGPHCKAVEGLVTTSPVVQAINGASVVFPTGWVALELAEKYVGGLVRWNTADGNLEIRTILRVTGGDTVLMSGLPVGLSVGSVPLVSIGCNHQMDDCGNIHHNILNFGGCAWIPKKNPIGFQNNQYY